MPPSISTTEEVNDLAILGKVQDDRTAEINRYARSRPNVQRDDEKDLETPIYDAFYDSGGPGTIISMKIFTPYEFEKCWTPFSDFVKKRWNVGRGRRCV